MSIIQSKIDNNTFSNNMIEKHHQALMDFLDNPSSIDNLSEFCLVKSRLNNTHENYIEKIKHILKHKPREFTVNSVGQIFGFGKYELLDIGWAESLVHFIKNNSHTAPFVTNPFIMPIDNQCNIAVFGDFGTGDYCKRKVGSTISNCIKNLNPDYAIHLGDIYYAATAQEVRENFLPFWPTAPLGNFTLNGNHEMYDGAKSYFNTVLKNEIFAKQQQNSYFALENDYWILACLDSSYFAEKTIEMDYGKIDENQANFLRELVKKNKPIIIMTHHRPLALNGIDKTDLFHQINDIAWKYIKYWYYGHIHCAAVYKEMDGIKFRLSGHAALPYGEPPLLKNNEKVIWYEKTKIPNDDSIKVQNGFSFLRLDNEKIIEEFYGEDEKLHWSNNT